MKYHGWDFKRCANEVRQILGTKRATIPHIPKPVIPSQPAQSPTRDCALKLWNQSSDSDTYVASHPYALRKRITHAAGARRGMAKGSVVGRSGADCIIVPQRTLAGELIGVECINADGAKQTLGNKGVLILGNEQDCKLPMLVLEGWASAAKWLDSRRWNACAVVSFGKGSTEKTTLALKAQYPNHTVICGVEHD